jgi:hypothetical protein
VAFLEAIKRGDDGAARGLLTKVARLKTEELGISVAPPVADTATYSVRDAEVVGETDDLVHVATTWTDVDADGFVDAVVGAPAERAIYVFHGSATGLPATGERVVGPTIAWGTQVTSAGDAHGRAASTPLASKL